MKYNYLVIEGVIGAGKTALSSKIASDYNANLILESFEDNSFLPKFYNDPDKYAFPLEMSFMASRFQQLKDKLFNRDIFTSFFTADYLFDKSLIFARVNLPESEFRLFQKFFNFIRTSVPRPDLIMYLYLTESNLRRNIIKRGRPYEQKIKSEYLEKLQQGYLNYFKQHKNYRILIIDSNKLDFVKYQADYEFVIDLLQRDYPPGITHIHPEK